MFLFLSIRCDMLKGYFDYVSKWHFLKLYFHIVMFCL